MTLREVLDEIEHDSDSDLVHSESESEVDSGDELESDFSEYDPGFHGQNDSNDGDALDTDDSDRSKSPVNNHAAPNVGLLRGRGRPGRARGRPRTRARGRGRAAAAATNRAQVHADDGWIIDNSVTDVHVHAPDFTGQCILNVPQPSTPIEWFELFFKEQDLELIARETNLYCRQYLEATPEDRISRNARVRDWVDTNADELKSFFTITFAMGIMPKPNIESFWTVDG